MLKMATEYEAQLAPFVDALLQRPAGAFRDGYFFRVGPDLRSAQEHPDTGYWSCDLTNGDKLTWSDKVYDLFGLPAGTPVEREWAVTRYSEHSKATLTRVRRHALDHDFCFILDAEISQGAGQQRWIRVLAVPKFANGRAVQLHGLKRPL